jgi:hypothetical protein
MTDPSVNAQPPRRGRPKGLPKTGGREKGTPNKLNQPLAELLKTLGADPGQVLARIMMNAKTDPELRRKCAADLMPYLHPRLQAIDQHVTGESQSVITIISGIARLPTDPIVDVTPTPPALSANLEPRLPEESVTGSDTPVALPVDRPSHPSSSPADAPWPALPSTSDPLADDNLDRSRASDAKIAELNSRAAKFVA